MNDLLFRQSEYLFRALIENAQDVIGLISADGTVLYASPAVRQFGWDPEQAIGQSIWDLVHPDDVPRARASLTELLKEPDRCVRLEMRTRDAHGNWRHKDALLHNLLQHPVVRAIVVNQHDITELKQSQADLNELNLQMWGEIQRREQAEELIRQSERRFRSVVEDQTEFIVRWRPDGTRTFVNSAYCRFFGQSREALIGQSFFPLITDEESRQQVRELTGQLTPENPIASYEHRVHRPDGSLAWTQWRDRAIFDEEGKLVEFQSVGRQQQEELAHVARVSVMGEMVAAMGHEIGQPLHVISTFVSAASKILDSDATGNREQVQQWLTKVQEQVTRAGDIIRRLREFTRADASHRQPLDLNAIVRQSLELTAADLRRKRVRLELQLAPNLPAVHADPIQVEQVLVNLLRNAAEAMQTCNEHDRPLRITTGCLENEVQVAVRDQGSGMTDDQLSQAGKAFFTTKPEGTGIGLAISRRIIEEHSGRLWPQRNPEGGMTFTFAVPVHTE
ncbi:MAG: PAS domain S-box protein [Pirellulaceae bacterium]|nr:PAS domain S-box protein [Pirellulaceae bacterium]